MAAAAELWPRANGGLLARQRGWLERTLAQAADLPAYRAALGRLSGRLDPFEQLTRLPVLERGDLQADPEAFRDPRRPSLEIHTSGSTATPLTYHLDRGARLRRLAQYARFFALHGWHPWHRSLSLKVLPDSSERVGTAWLDRTLLGRRRVASVLAPPGAHLRLLQALDPHVLHGTPSALEQLAAEVLQGGWRPTRLHRIFTASEAAEPELRRRLERVLGGVVVDHYGAAEAFIGWECERRRGYHLNARSVLLEILDDGGAPVAAGQTGRVVITTLDNPAMPLLRYAIGDCAVQGDGRPCACGRPQPMLPRVMGRAVEVFLLPSGPRSPWGAVARMREVQGLRRFQLVQTEADRIVVRVQSRDPRRPAEAKHIADLVHIALGDDVRVEVVETDQFPRLPSGKFAPALRGFRARP